MVKDTTESKDSHESRDSKQEITHGPKGLSATGQRAMQGAPETKEPSLDSQRQKAVRDAWKQEADLVKATGQGTREWKPHEIRSLTKEQKVAGYEGHHMRSVNGHSPKWAADPRNIEFVTRQEHLQRHSGDFHMPTTGNLIDRQKMINMAAKNHQPVRYSPNKEAFR